MFCIKSRIERIIARRNLQKRIRAEQYNEESLNIKGLSQAVKEPLTPAEEQEVRQLWGKLNPAISMREYEVFKAVNGFDAKYLSHHTYLPLLARRINNYRYTKFFEHKSLLGYLVNSPMRFPECYVRCIDGELYGGDMRQITRAEAGELCLRQDCLIYKDSENSSGGKSVVKLRLSPLEVHQRRLEVQRLLTKGSRNFVIQECISQHPSTACFNPSSVNTFRVTSLYLNGLFSVLSVVFRFGKRGMEVDNWGAGGIMIGVHSDGYMYTTGYDANLNPYTTYGETDFSKSVFPKIQEMLDLVRYAHESAFPLCKLVGWDICIGADGHPLIVEINSSQPGVFIEQICTGPIFGDRTEEVIEYCMGKPFSY